MATKKVVSKPSSKPTPKPVGKAAPRPTPVSAPRPTSVSRPSSPASVQKPTLPRAVGNFVSGTPNWAKPVIIAASQRYNIPPNILSALLKQESGFNPNAKSPAGAVGIAQFMPDTAKGMGIDPMNWQQAIHGAASYLRNSLNTFGGNMQKALASYNAGAGAVQQYNGVPPYQETQNYVKNIMAMASSSEQDTGETQQSNDPFENINRQLDALQTKIQPYYDSAVKNTNLISGYVGKYGWPNWAMSQDKQSMQSLPSSLIQNQADQTVSSDKSIQQSQKIPDIFMSNLTTQMPAWGTPDKKKQKDNQASQGAVFDISQYTG